MQTYFRSDGNVMPAVQPNPWLIGKREDILYFFLPVFAALLVFFMAQHPVVSNSMFLSMIAAYGFGLGPLHQGPSWFTYFDKDNRTYYASNLTNRIRFFFLPPILMITGVLATLLCTQFLFAALTLCHIDHLLQQSVRLSRLYRKDDAYAAANPKMEGISQYSIAVAFSMVGFYRFNFLQFATVPGAYYWTVAACILAFVCVCVYVGGILKRRHEGLPIHYQSLLFWVISVLAWAPGAFVTNFYLAFLIPLTIHWFQFLGMNATLVERKAAAARKLHPESVKKDAMIPPALKLFAVCFTYMSMFVLIDYLSQTTASVVVKGLSVGVLSGLAMNHYMLDTFIWRWQDEYPKQHILPYIASQQ